MHLSDIARQRRHSVWWLPIDENAHHGVAGALTACPTVTLYRLLLLLQAARPYPGPSYASGPAFEVDRAALAPPTPYAQHLAGPTCPPACLAMHTPAVPSPQVCMICKV